MRQINRNNSYTKEKLKTALKQIQDYKNTSNHKNQQLQIHMSSKRKNCLSHIKLSPMYREVKNISLSLWLIQELSTKDNGQMGSLMGLASSSLMMALITMVHLIRGLSMEKAGLFLVRSFIIKVK